jgi:hypothetical protein
VTVVQFEYADGTRSEEKTLNWDEWQKLWKTAIYEGRSVAAVEIVNKHDGKGPNRIEFE